MADIEKLKLLSSQMTLEPDGGCPTPTPHNFRPPGKTVVHNQGPDPQTLHFSRAALPNGSRIRLLKSLLSSYCRHDCRYCPFQTGRDTARARFEPEEFANLFTSLHRADLVQGIFLSSGVYQSPSSSQDKLLDTARILRERHGFRGYLHLKIMPGAERAQVKEAMLLADRLSVNLEAPTPPTLSRLAPEKNWGDDLLRPLRWIAEIRRDHHPRMSWNNRWPSSSTQFVIGPAGETDWELLSATDHLYQVSGVSRAYYSSFTPIPNTPLEGHPPASRTRELRLYQASFLLRDYGYDLEDLPFETSGALPLHQDPKTAWAEKFLKDQPQEINTASRETLLRIPGLGPRSTQKILAARRRDRIRTLEQVQSLGIQTARAAPYLEINGKLPARQLSLF